MPNVPEDYVHRIGRTGRAGSSGQAVSLVSADEFKLLRDIERLIGKAVEREKITGFEPIDEVSGTPKSPAKPATHKPKKNRRKKKKSTGNGNTSSQGQSLYQGKKKTSAKPNAANSKRRRRPATNRAGG